MGDNFIKFSSVPLPDGGDTHIHPFGLKPINFTITTRIPIGDGLGSISIHENPLDPSNSDTNNIKWKP